MFRLINFPTFIWLVVATVTASLPGSNAFSRLPPLIWASPSMLWWPPFTVNLSLPTSLAPWRFFHDPHMWQCSSWMKILGFYQVGHSFLAWRLSNKYCHEFSDVIGYGRRRKPLDPHSIIHLFNTQPRFYGIFLMCLIPRKRWEMVEKRLGFCVLLWGERKPELSDRNVKSWTSLVISVLGNHGTSMNLSFCNLFHQKWVVLH